MDWLTPHVMVIIAAALSHRHVLDVYECAFSLAVIPSREENIRRVNCQLFSLGLFVKGRGYIKSANISICSTGACQLQAESAFPCARGEPFGG